MTQKKYNIAIDGGGSKLQAILFDDDLDFVSSAQADGVNPSCYSKEEIHKNIEICLQKLFENFIPDRISNVHGVLFQSTETYRSMIEKYTPCEKVVYLAEGVLGSLASCIYKESVVALSGTGSSIFHIIKDKVFKTAGGYGYIVGDEGSGFYLGQLALRSAIRAYENRAPYTQLVPLITEYLGGNDLRDAVFSLYKHPSLPKIVSSLTRVVGKAAKDGDVTAMELIKDNAVLLARQTISMIKMDDISIDVPVCIIGGTFKTNPLMLDSFLKTIEDNEKNRIVKKPIFEPVAASIIYYAIESGIQLDQVLIDRIMTNFKDYVYRF
jgi:N-acetylglucosamine kinase-like BadF-type ATPase